MGFAILAALPSVAGLAAGPAAFGPIPLISADGGGANVTNLTPPTSFNVVHYNSSVDGFPLSYDEWLPIGFRLNGSYPLIIYLHGQQSLSPGWTRGGIVNDFTDWLHSGTPAEKATADSMVNLSRADGYILVALNSRSGAGWYVNSPCGGPQFQDVMDAIAHERAARHVNALYLFGTSMGTEGTEYVASRNPGLFRAIGLIAPVSDLFMDVAYRQTLVSVPGDSWANASIQAKARDFCGILPGTGNSSELAVAHMFQNMSPLRFDPAAFNGTPIYLSAGGDDNRAPNNVKFWPAYLQANNTFVNSTCNVAKALGEPANCTDTFYELHQRHPAIFNFRYMYEPLAGHTISQMDAADMLAYWAGTLPGGYFQSEYPFTVISIVHP